MIYYPQILMIYYPKINMICYKTCLLLYLNLQILSNFGPFHSQSPPSRCETNITSCSCLFLTPSTSLMPSRHLTLLTFISLPRMMDGVDLVAVYWHCKGEYPLFAYCIHDKFCIDFAILSHGAWNSH